MGLDAVEASAGEPVFGVVSVAEAGLVFLEVTDTDVSGSSGGGAGSRRVVGAEFGLAALIAGGAAAVAAKKGVFAVIAGFLAAAWKFILVAVIGAFAWIKSLFKKKNQ